jgi:hypothetical protein
MKVETSMSIKPVRVGFHTLLALLAIGSLSACERAQTVNPKADLIRSLKGADVQGYLFSLNEGETQTTSALTNKAVQNVITLGKKDTGVVLRYTRVEDKKTNTSKTYKSEITKQDGSLALVVTELATDAVIEKGSFPVAGPACEPAGQFDSINACIDEFNCTNKGPLQCQANRTCKPQLAALTCCLKDGSIVSVHLIIQPVIGRWCLLQELTPGLAGGLLSQD